MFGKNEERWFLTEGLIEGRQGIDGNPLREANTADEAPVSFDAPLSVDLDRTANGSERVDKGCFLVAPDLLLQLSVGVREPPFVDLEDTVNPADRAIAIGELSHDIHIGLGIQLPATEVLGAKHFEKFRLEECVGHLRVQIAPGFRLRPVALGDLAQPTSSPDDFFPVHHPLLVLMIPI
ncbi:hypothetical protein HRbin27_01087 [bacterium HR27]|nr:hypothetical protein HRbin27_01087 [bacterium HR27]